MAGFVVPHLGHHRAGRLISLGQALQVAGQMLLDLALGLHHEAQADAVTSHPAAKPMAKAPAYHSGFSRLVLAPRSARRRSVQAR